MIVITLVGVCLRERHSYMRKYNAYIYSAEGKGRARESVKESERERESERGQESAVQSFDHGSLCR